MNNIKRRLQEIKGKLKGREITGEEIIELKRRFSEMPYLEDLFLILSEYKIIGQTFSIPENEDISEIGAELEWMTPKDQIEEAFEFFPGILAANKGYFPIGTCLEGSGDPYFINVLDDELFVVRISHESTEDELEIDKVVSFAGLFGYLEEEN